MRAETAIFVVMFKKAEMVSIGEAFEDFILLQESIYPWPSCLQGDMDSTTSDRHAVALLKVDGSIVRHVPREFSRVFWHFLACAKQMIPATGKEACA